MKRKYARLAEVQLDSPRHAASPGLLATGVTFAVQLPEGATVAVPAGFEAEEVFRLLTVVREALRCLCRVRPRAFFWHQPQLAEDPRSGHLFLFCNKTPMRLKVLCFDGTGLWMCAKRLERGSFTWPAGEVGTKGG